MRSTFYRLISFLISVLSATLLASCVARTAAPLLPGKIAPSILLPVVQSGIVDGRARFREIFKEVLAVRSKSLPKGVPHDDAALLWKLSGEAQPSGRPVCTETSKNNYRVLIVPGLMAECIAHVSTAFEDARKQVEEAGYRTGYIQTRGRRSSSFNAGLIRDAVLAMPEGERIIFVTHSKGTVDALEALVTYPALAERTAALISFSGAVNGSPLADSLPEFLMELAHRIPLSSCPPGEGMEAVESLRRNVRLTWMSEHQLPGNLRYYSLAAFAARAGASRLLRPFYDILTRTEPVNDGQVICSDAIIPGSVLLGYPNADHWAIAMPVSAGKSPLLASVVDKNDYPRAVLLEAALRFVEEDLGT